MIKRLLLPAVALLAACGDAATAPLAPADAPSRGTISISSSTGSSSSGGDTSRVSFSYGPNTSVTVRVGAHKVVFPTNAVCDPATSGYGPATWNSACTPLSKYITFQAKAWTDASGRPQIRFSPDVRFVPTKTVTLYLYDKAAANDPAFRFAWCPTGAASCVDESKTDASLVPQRDPANGFLFGRIKHFSGYTVVVDRAGGEDSGFGF
ncbi:hypothetical protein [Roseisolibacter sp. H3M3-2]|uniref:hypothetical protein n=1 Tax=Roseisolibacter sp. H3M3-2 TaxID=3031323 RepID=UPI0023DCBC62|nr:hypothetical protein [Roseisolibacter sp. H3M3-2]MDF1502767.1 hypothetical protein [Roseisolibacter sp. H3M3-2]